MFLFEHGYFNYILHIQTKNKKTSLKIPFPFHFFMFENILHFDYTIKQFTSGIKEIEEIVDNIKIKNPSKFFNNIVKIKCL